MCKSGSNQSTLLYSISFLSPIYKRPHLCGNDMSFSFQRSQAKKEEAYRPEAREGDPLLPPKNRNNTDSGLRSRRTASKSPPALNDDFGSTGGANSVPMRRPDESAGPEHDEAGDSYQGFVAIHDDEVSGGRSLRQPGSLPSITDDEESAPYSLPSQKEADLIGMGPSQYHRPRSPEDSRSLDSNSQPPLLEIPEETYAVRKAALKVMKPLTKTWVRGRTWECFITIALHVKTAHSSCCTRL